MAIYSWWKLLAHRPDICLLTFIYTYCQKWFRNCVYVFSSSDTIINHAKKIATNVWWMKHEAKKYLIMAIWGLSMFFKSLGCTCTYDDHYEMNGRLMQVSGCFIYCRRFFSKFTWHDLRKFHQMYLYFYQFLTEQFNIFLYTFNPNKLLIIFK